MCEKRLLIIMLPKRLCPDANEQQQEQYIKQEQIFQT